MTNNRIKTWGQCAPNTSPWFGLGGGLSNGNKTSQGWGLTEMGRDEGVWGLLGCVCVWVGGVRGVMITENKKATEVRPLLRPASNYTHRHKNIHGGFQSGHQAAAEVSHGYHVCWPMASRLINKQWVGRTDKSGGGAGERQPGGG